MAARKPAEAATQRIADHADVGRRAGERGEAMLGGGVRDVLPLRARLDPRDLLRGVDLHAAHPLELDEQDVVVPALGPGAVAGALRGDAQIVVARELDGRDHVGRRLGDHDDRGPLVGREVPGRTGLVPVCVCGSGDVADEPQAQLGDSVCGVFRSGNDGAHLDSYLVKW